MQGFEQFHELAHTACGVLRSAPRAGLEGSLEEWRFRV